VGALNLPTKKQDLQSFQRDSCNGVLLEAQAIVLWPCVLIRKAIVSAPPQGRFS